MGNCSNKRDKNISTKLNSSSYFSCNYLSRSERCILNISQDHVKKLFFNSEFFIPSDSALGEIQNKKFIIVGGTNSGTLQSSVYSIDISTLILSVLPSLPIPTTQGQILELNGYIYLIGALQCCERSLIPAPLLRFSLKKNEWEEIKVSSVAYLKIKFSSLINFGSTVLNKTIFIFGGQRLNKLGNVKPNLMIFSLILNSEAILKMEGKMPAAMIRPIIASGNNHGLISGAASSEENDKKHWYYFKYINSRITLHSIESLDISNKENYPPLYTTDYVVFFSYPQLIIRYRAKKNWHLLEIENNKIKNLNPEIRNSGQSFRKSLNDSKYLNHTKQNSSQDEEILDSHESIKEKASCDILIQIERQPTDKDKPLLDSGSLISEIASSLVTDKSSYLIRPSIEVTPPPADPLPAAVPKLDFSTIFPQNIPKTNPYYIHPSTPMPEKTLPALPGIKRPKPSILAIDIEPKNHESDIKSYATSASAPHLKQTPILQSPKSTSSQGLSSRCWKRPVEINWRDSKSGLPLGVIIKRSETGEINSPDSLSPKDDSIEPIHSDRSRKNTRAFSGEPKQQITEYLLLTKSSVASPKANLGELNEMESKENPEFMLEDVLSLDQQNKVTESLQPYIPAYPKLNKSKGWDKKQGGKNENHINDSDSEEDIMQKPKKFVNHEFEFRQQRVKINQENESPKSSFNLTKEDFDYESFSNGFLPMRAWHSNNMNPRVSLDSNKSSAFLSAHNSSSIAHPDLSNISLSETKSFKAESSESSSSSLYKPSI